MIKFGVACHTYPRAGTIKTLILQLLWVKLLLSAALLSGCGGGGGSSSRPSLVTTSATITEADIAYLFADIPQFDGAKTTAISVDVATGAVRVYGNAAQLQGFLVKQPAALEDQLFAEAPLSYVRLSHLAHQINRTNDASGSLSFDATTRNAALFLRNEEIALTLPLQLTDEGFEITSQLDDIIFEKNGVRQAPHSSQLSGQFFGADGKDIGVLFTLLQQDGVFTGASIGTRP